MRYQASVAGDRLSHLVQAGEGVTAALRADDRAALITFSHAVDLRVPLTDDIAPIRSALRAIGPRGATALRDAIQSRWRCSRAAGAARSCWCSPMAATRRVG